MCLKRKMARVEETYLHAWNVTPERLCAGRQEKWVVLTPDRQKWGLAFTEIGLEFWVKRDVALVVAKKIELDLIRAGTGQIEVIERVSVRRNRGRVSDAVGVLPDRRLRRKERAKRRAIGFGRVLPVRPDRVPTVAQPFFIGIAVLRDNCRDALWMVRNDAKSGRRAVVEYIDREPREPNHFGEAVDHAGQMIEGVGKVRGHRHIRAAEARQVGRDEPKAVGEHRNEIAEHVARGRKAMQQQENGSVCGAGLTVKHLEAVDVSGLVFDDGHGTFLPETAACRGQVVELAGIF